ncbi:hypothetical protein WMW71_10315 [Flavobacterium buctense]|uniref:Metalloprotease n=1 Tax=Flavobacterium buctense TaxID=1648146 RepID=A0ABU9E260_9FLAO|nr:hypothetical protein [Flavobacterium buctense]
MKFFKLQLLFSLLLVSTFVSGQNQWFSTYTDSVALIKESNRLSELFKADIKKLKPELDFKTGVLLNTTPYLIFYGENDTVNLPLWSQVIPPIKGFTAQVAGSEADGERMFGLFFNGFYLPHELGHALQDYVDKKNANVSFKNEYLANEIAMLWWRKQGKEKELKACYELAKSMYAKLPNPVPEGQTAEEYFTKNYEQAAGDPFVYGYMQFAQFIKVYEDQSLPDFDIYITNYFKKLD